MFGILYYINNHNVLFTPVHVHAHTDSYKYSFFPHYYLASLTLWW